MEPFKIIYSNNLIYNQFICSLFYALFPFLCFMLVILQFKMIPKRNAEVLSSVLSSGRLRYALVRIQVLDKLCSGISYSAFGCEFSVNRSTIYVK